MAANKQYKLEYTVKASPYILYEFIATQPGLSQWFADEVDLHKEYCIFKWNGSENKAFVLDEAEDQFIRFRWDYQKKNEFFEFRITKAEVTGDTILTITDFAPKEEIEDQKLLWDSQIKTLMQQMGTATM